MQLHYSHLSEKDRRHYAAMEVIESGLGGVTCISKVLLVGRNTIREGKKEFPAFAAAGNEAAGKRQRKAGGGN